MTTRQLTPESLREALASIEHDQWMAWSKNLSGMEVLSEDRLDRWEASWVPYDQLTEAQKDMDREWADKVLAALARYTEGLVERVADALENAADGRIKDGKPWARRLLALDAPEAQE